MSEPKYKLLVEDYDVTPFVIYHLNHVMGDRLNKYMDEAPTCFFEFDDGNVNWYMEFKRWNEHGKQIVDELVDDPTSYDDFNSKLRQDINILKEKSHNLFHEDLSNESLKELWNTYADMIEIFEQVYERGMVPTIADLDTPFLSNKLQEILAEYTDKPNEAFVPLTTPTEMSDILKEEKDRLEIKLQKDEPTQEQLQNHHDKYFWLTHGYEGPLYTTEEISEAIDELDTDEAKTRYQELQDYEKKTQAKINSVVNGLGLEDKEIKLFEVANEWLYLKGIRKESFFACYAAMDKVADHMSANAEIDKKDLKHLTKSELKTLVFEQKIPEDLSERFSESVYTYEANEDIVRLNKSAAQYVDRNVKTEEVQDVNKVDGQVAFSGHVTGEVKLISEPEDMEKMNEGDVLVSPATNPNLLPAMKQAAAIVTDVGGITCHAAITSREIKTPCVIGTEIATKVFSDGDRVEVNAEEGFIKIAQE